MSLVGNFPGVYPKITDLSQIVSANSITSCAYVGEAEFGPINKPTLVTNLRGYNDKFGKLNSKYGYMGYSLAVAADSINNHYIVRVVDEDTARYAIATAALSGKDISSYTPQEVTVGLMNTINEKEDATALFDYLVEDTEVLEKNSAFKVLSTDPNNRDLRVEIIDSTINTNKNYKASYAMVSGNTVKVMLPAEGLFKEDDSIVVSSAQQSDYDARTTVKSVSNSYQFSLADNPIVEAGSGYAEGEVVHLKNTSLAYTGELMRVKILSVSDLGAIESVELLDTIDYNSVATTEGKTLTIDDGTGSGGKIKVKQLEVANVIFFDRDSEKTYEPTLPTDFRILLYPIDSETTFAIRVYEKVENALSLVEQYEYLTLFANKDQYGNSTYVEDVINGRSNYINVFVNPLVTDESSADYIKYPIPAFYSGESKLELKGGTSGTPIMRAENGMKYLTQGWSKFNDRTQTSVSILMNCGYSFEGNNAYQEAMLAVAEKRRDCFCLFDVPSTATDSENVLDWRKNDQGFNTYRGAVFTPWVKAYNSAEGKRNFSMAPSAYIAKIIGAAGEPWIAPAGPNRGMYTSSVVSPTGLSSYYNEDVGGELYSAQLNCGIKDLAGFSNWGQKTLQMKPSAMDRINVARTVIYVETTLRDAARYHLFENNTAFERMQITLQFNQFLDTILNGGGLSRYQVICDDTNNTPYIIAQNQLVIDVYLWPVYTTEFIALNTIVMGADAEITVTSNAN